jgi:hypothetical protein
MLGGHAPQVLFLPRFSFFRALVNFRYVELTPASQFGTLQHLACLLCGCIF